MEHGPTVFAGPPSGQSAHQFFGVHLDVDDVVNLLSDLG
jgi:hypothetical protein